MRNDDKSWRFIKGKDEFTFTKREAIEKVNINDVIDPDIKKTIIEQKGKGIDVRKIKDHQGNIIRHVRVKTRAGKKVKERLNYKSKHNYKNAYYSASGEIPYAIFLTNSDGNNIERKMIPVAIHEIAQVFKDIHKFDIEYYINKFHPNVSEHQDVKLLKVGQKVFVLKNDMEFERKQDIEFQMNRMYKISQFYDDGEGGIYLKYHLEATKDDDIDKNVKETKHKFIEQYDTEFGLPAIVEDLSELDISKRKKDFNDRKYRFVGLKDERFSRLIPFLGEEKVKEIKKEVSKYKKQSSIIEKEGETPLLKISTKDCNFLFENYNFEIDIAGDLKWLE